MNRYKELLEMTRTPGADCILWPYPPDDRGYGQVRVNGKHQRAHREALQIFSPAPKGKICSVKGNWVSGDKLHAAHGPCHDKLCINPLHLSWRTFAENNSDRRRDGTWGFKLDAEEVAEIRAEYATGRYLQRELAEYYGVNQPQISHIVNGKSW